LNKKIKEEIQALCQHNADQEICGLVYWDGKKVKITPGAEDPNTPGHVSTRSEEFLQIWRNHKILCVFRGLPRAVAAIPAADQAFSEESAIPSLIYDIGKKKFSYYEPKTFVPQPLLGRPYIRGYWDCYTAVRDWYREHGVQLRYYFPPEDDAYFNFDLIEKNYANEGFYEIPLNKAQPGDCYCFGTLKGTVIVHCAVYIGDNTVFQHARNKPSELYVLNDRVLRCLKKVLRQRNFHEIASQGSVFSS